MALAPGLREVRVMKCARYDDMCDCPVCADDRDRRVFEVDFQSRTTSKTRWTAKFDLGTAKENSAAAVEAAWKLNADITGQRFLVTHAICIRHMNRRDPKSDI